MALNEADTIQTIRSKVLEGKPVACHAVGYGDDEHWLVAYQLTGQNGSIWATAGINVLDPYCSDDTSYNGREVSIWNAMQSSYVTLGIDKIRVPY